MAIYLLRHGELHTDGKWRFIGQGDITLNAEGERQARWWKKKFSDIRFNRIYTSDLNRARRTAEIISESKGIEIEMLSELREIDLGAWHGLTRSEVDRLFPGQFEKRGQDLARYRPRGGESFSDLQIRVQPVFDRIKTKMNPHILVVAHAGVNRAILCHYLGVPLENIMRIGQDYGALNIIQFGTGFPRVIAMNRLPENE